MQADSIRIQLCTELYSLYDTVCVCVRRRRASGVSRIEHRTKEQTYRLLTVIMYNYYLGGGWSQAEKRS